VKDHKRSQSPSQRLATTERKRVNQQAFDAHAD
jgi:hypothetical protein